MTSHTALRAPALPPPASGKPTTTALGTSVSALVQLVQDKGLTDVASYVR